MVFVCSFPIEVKSIDKFYQYLGKSDDSKYYYISKNYLDEFFRINKEDDGLNIFLKELSLGQLEIMDAISSWLGIHKNAVVHMTMEEMETFTELVEVSDSEDVFLNLMESKDGKVSLGQHIFINSLVEIVRRFRDGG